MRFYTKYIALLAITMTAVATVSAQDLQTGYFSKGFLYQHDLNPAAGNDQNYVAVPILGNTTIKMMGDFGYGDVVMKNPLYPNQSDKKMTTFLNPYVEDPLAGFATKDNRLSGQFKMTMLSAGFKGLGGYNTIELNARAKLNGKVPYELLRFACDVNNEDYDIGNLKADAIAFSELAFGHSHDVSDQLRIGAKLKLLLGIGNVSAKMENVQAKFNNADAWTVTANAESHVSIKGFEYEMGTMDYDAREGELNYVKDVNVDNGGLAGFGLAADLGMQYKINDDLTLSAALLDLGYIRWNNDYYAKNVVNSFTFSGFHDVSMKKHEDDNLEAQTDRYVDQVTDFTHLTDQGDLGAHTTGIGATVNVGCEYVLPSYKPLSFGLLATQRINGDYSWTEGRLSANWSPKNWVDAAASVSVSNFAASVGWLVNFHPKGCNFFIGMDQILGKYSKEGIPLNSNASVSLGLNICW